MAGIRLGQRLNVQPVLIPHDLVNAEHRTSYVDLNLANWVTFVAQYAAATTGSTSDTMLISVEASSIETSAGATKIPFTYRLTSAIDTSGMAALVAGTSDGASVNTSDLTNSCLVVDVDPAILPGRGERYRFVTFVSTPGSSLACVAGVVAYSEPRYPGNSIPSSS